MPDDSRLVETSDHGTVQLQRTDYRNELQGTGVVVREAKVQVGIRRAKQNRCVAPNSVTDNRLRVPEAHIDQTIPVVRGGYGKFLCFGIYNDPALESKEEPNIHVAQKPIKRGHLRAKVGSGLMFCESFPQSAVAKFRES
jgi:hypothetical protein